MSYMFKTLHLLMTVFMTVCLREFSLGLLTLVKFFNMTQCTRAGHLCYSATFSCSLWDHCWHYSFLTCVSHTAHVIGIGWTSVCPSVCPSVCLSLTRWYCVETAQSIVKLSSLPGSPMILVFWGPNFFPDFQWEHPNGRDMKKLQFLTNI